MYVKLNEKEKELYERISERTEVDYEITDMIEIDSLKCMIKDLMCEIHRLDEKIEDIYEYNNVEPKEENICWEDM